MRLKEHLLAGSALFANISVKYDHGSGYWILYSAKMSCYRHCLAKSQNFWHYIFIVLKHFIHKMLIVGAN